MSARSTTTPSRWQRYCWRRREPQPLCRRLKETAPLACVAEYSLTGIETSPKDSVSDAIERAAIGPPQVVSEGAMVARKAALSGGRRAPRTCERRILLQFGHAPGQFATRCILF